MNWLLNFEHDGYYVAEAPDLRNDPRFRQLLSRNLHQPALFWGKHSVASSVAEIFLGVSNNVVKVNENRYVMLSGCVQHRCPELQGFLWVDTAPESREVFFAALTVMPGQEINSQWPSFFCLWIFANRELHDDVIDTQSHAEIQTIPDQFLYPMQDWIDRTGGRHVVSAMFVGPDGKMTPLLTRNLHLPDFRIASEVKTKEQQ